jgi:vitamin B12 transporter
MRALVWNFLLVFSFLGISLVASATDFNVKVVDPRGAAVWGAQVTLVRPADSSVLAAVTTSAEGIAILHTEKNGPFQINILAPGFAAEAVAVQSAQFTVNLRLATASETVVVSATRSPIQSDEAGADVAALSGTQLETMQPIAANDAVRFLPGAVVNTAGQRGGLASLFVRGGESNYNKVIVDGVTVNEPGGTFDFGTLSMAQGDRMEFVRGAQSTLYGSDAMTSVVQMWTRTGSTHTPELRLGADAGNQATESGHLSLAGARGPFDYNVFGDQFNTEGSGVNDAYSDSLQGANIGLALGDRVALRARMRHSNSHTGLPGEWSFNGYDPLVPVDGGPELAPLQPNPSAWSQLNNVLGSVDLSIAAPNGWQHRLTVSDYVYRYNQVNPGDDARVDPFGDPIDFASQEVDHINRLAFEYQGDYSERTWAHTTFGYRVENENGFVGDVLFGAQNHGQRLNNDVYAQQLLALGRLTIIAGGRFAHSSTFGDTGLPRVAAALQVLRGGRLLSGTRLRFSYATGFKEPRLEETFNGIPTDPYNLPNTGLKPERSRSFEAGFQQNFYGGKYVLNGTYFNNLFRDQINYVEVDPINFVGQYVNVNEAFAQGAEAEFQARLRSRLLLHAAYTYTSSEYLDNPSPFIGVYDPGQPLLRRPKHSATFLLSYLGPKWGANLGGSFVGRRSDSDFDNFGIDHAAGYVRADVGGWYEFHRRITAYVNVENALDRKYNEVVGYPSLPINFRAGMRFRIGGE